MELIWDAVNFFKKKMTSNRESLNAVLEAYEHKKQIDSKEWEVVYGKHLSYLMRRGICVVNVSELKVFPTIWVLYS